MTSDSFNSHPLSPPCREDCPADIVLECNLPDPPQKVWRALTVPELVAAWLMPNDIRPRAGARFSFRPVDREPSTPSQARAPGATPGAPVRRVADSVDCEVLEVEPNHLLRYRWTARESIGSAERMLDSVVSFELTPTADGGTHLRVVHGEFRVATVIPPPSREHPAPGAGTRKDPVALASSGTPVGSAVRVSVKARAAAHLACRLRWAA